ncbi:MAG TPA: DUF2191 domain-containing protein [Oligoflexia bacterium]|nr:DUF2191 domain-containing protein [Oligoflexia bacterium]HMP48227.1 DUF2191 domain-containing protein [Oligoflexia bacterium]
MKTTVDIPDDMLKELVKNSRSSKKKDAILKAIEEYNRKCKLITLAKHLGTFEGLISKSELSNLRKIIKS